MSPPPDEITLEAARVLWNYHKLGEDLRPADGIVVFGSNDLRVADYAAELYHQRMGSWIVFSGGRGRMTEHWPDTEAACFAARAGALGVPDTALHCESAASHTGENIVFSRQLIQRLDLKSDNLIILQKPYMERRTRASVEMQWPELRFQVSSPPLDFEEYPSDTIGTDELIHAMLGDLYRIMDYPAKGLSREQPLPAHVRESYDHLVNKGYTRQLPC